MLGRIATNGRRDDVGLAGLQRPVTADVQLLLGQRAGHDLGRIAGHLSRADVGGDWTLQAGQADIVAAT
ncbi:hypothetical protein, partial [Caulobacter sp.]|uniref:hypothetical protein n=1 Tax=Caulobacter sp. TaxID=78 RepID=UPI001B04EC3D